MSYRFESRIRYSEIGENGCLTLPALLDYFQDCGTFQSEDIGQGMEVLKKRNRAWILAAWQIVVSRYPKLGEEVVTVTAPYDFHSVMGMRNYYMETKEGERLAWANTFWTNFDTRAQMPARITEEDIKGYDLDEKLDMEYAPRKIRLPEQWVPKEAFVVQKHHLDTNHHVNNGQYIRMAEDYLPDGFAVHQMRAEYKAQARLHDEIRPSVSVQKDQVTVLLKDRENKPYAIVEFR